MLIKLAYCQQQLGYRRGLRDEERSRVESLIKTASSNLERILVDQARNFYIDSWAVSEYERFGLNENSDGFRQAELKKAHRTFIGSMVCVDHENTDKSLSIGTNIDSVYMPDGYVRVAMAVDRERAQARRPGLEQRIDSGDVTDTSMGVYATSSECTNPKCANVARDESEFCPHVIPREMGGMRGMVLCDVSTNWIPIKMGELNQGLLFFENTIITFDEGADPNAKILEKMARVTSPGKRREIDALLQAAREIAEESGPEGIATLARLVHRIREIV